MIVDENSANVLKETVSAGSGKKTSTTRTSFGSAKKATAASPKSASRQKRQPDESPAKSLSKRKDTRKSPLSTKGKSATAADKDKVVNRRDTADPTDLADLMNCLDDSTTENDLDTSTTSTASVASSRSTRSTRSRGKIATPWKGDTEETAPVQRAPSPAAPLATRRSSRLSEGSTASATMSAIVDSLSPLAPNRRDTVDPAEVDALLDMSTTSSQMRHLTSASPTAIHTSITREHLEAMSHDTAMKRRRSSRRLSNQSAISDLSVDESNTSADAICDAILGSLEQTDKNAMKTSETALPVDTLENSGISDEASTDLLAELGMDTSTSNDIAQNQQVDIAITDKPFVAEESPEPAQEEVLSTEPILEPIPVEATAVLGQEAAPTLTDNISEEINLHEDKQQVFATTTDDDDVDMHTIDTESNAPTSLPAIEEESDVGALLAAEEEADAFMQATRGCGSSMNSTRNSRRLTADSIDVAALMAELGEDDSPAASPAFQTEGRHSLASIRESIGSILSGSSAAPSPVAPITAEEMAVEQNESSVMSYKVVEPVAVSARKSAVRRASMSTSVVMHASRSTALFSPGVNAGPRRATTDLTDLKELAAELQREQQQEEEEDEIAAVMEDEEQAPVIQEQEHHTMQTNDVVASPTISVVESEDDSIVSLGALISRRGTMETVESSFASFTDGNGFDSRRESRLSFAPPVGSSGAAPTSPTVPSRRSSLQQPGSALKSCLSSKKTTRSRLSLAAASTSNGDNSTRKSVIFGSPKAAEFVKDAATNQMTPLARSEAKSLFSMVGSAPRLADDEPNDDEDDMTRENSTILEEWERLTNTSNGDNSDEDAGEFTADVDEFPLPPTPVLPDTPDSSVVKSARRRSSGHLPKMNLSSPVQSVNDQPSAQLADTSVSMDIGNTSNISEVSENATVTVALPANFQELLAQNDDEPVTTVPNGMSRGEAFIAQHRQSLDFNASIMSNTSDDSGTMPLEVDLNAMLRHVDYADTGLMPDDCNMSLNSTGSNKTTSSGSSAASLGGVLGLSSSTAVSCSMPSSPAVPVSPMHLSTSTHEPYQMDITCDGPTAVPNVEQQQQQISFTTHSPAPTSQISPAPERTSHMEVEPSRTTTEHVPAIASTPLARAPNTTAPGSEAASAMMDRLRAMNDNSRRHTLSAMSQVAVAGTPLGQGGVSRLSLDARRKALVNSATKARSESKQLIGSLTAMQQAMASMRQTDDTEVSFAGATKNGVTFNDGDADSSTDTVEMESEEVSAVAASPIAVEPVQEQVPVLSVEELFESAKLAEGTPMTNQPFGLLAAIKQLQNTCAPKIMDQLSDSMIDSIRTAISQAKVIPAAQESLCAKWCEASDTTHEHVQSLLNVPTTASGSPGLANAPDNLLISLGKQCRQISAKRWSNWEGDIMDSTTRILQDAIADMKDRRLEILREANSIRASAADPVTATQHVEEQHSQLAAIQTQIASTRLNIDKSKAEIEDLVEKTSTILEQRKDILVRMAQDYSHQAANDQQRTQRILSQQQELNNEWTELSLTQQSVGVIDRMGYFKTLRYQLNCISVEIALTNKVRAVIDFTLSSSLTGLVVDTIEVETVKYGDVYGDAESDLAMQYFNNILSNNAIRGPLSDGALAQIDACAEIPPLLACISGYILSLRRTIAAMNTFNIDGYNWACIDNNIQITFPGGKYMLLLPWQKVLSGGITALCCTALRSTSSQGQEIVAEYPMKAVIASLQMRYGVQERGYFQDFPAHALRREVEAIVKHL